MKFENSANWPTGRLSAASANSILSNFFEFGVVFSTYLTIISWNSANRPTGRPLAASADSILSHFFKLGVIFSTYLTPISWNLKIRPIGPPAGHRQHRPTNNWGPAESILGKIYEIRAKFTGYMTYKKGTIKKIEIRPTGRIMTVNRPTNSIGKVA